jgi:hypothetical protein
MSSLVEYHCTPSESSDNNSIESAGEDIERSSRQSNDDACELTRSHKLATVSPANEEAQKRCQTAELTASTPEKRIRTFPHVEGQWAMVVQIPGA